MLTTKKVEGDTFWYVLARHFEEKDENGNEVAHKSFYSMPYVFHIGDDDGIMYDPERMFETEFEANQCAFTLTSKEGY